MSIRLEIPGQESYPIWYEWWPVSSLLKGMLGTEGGDRMRQETVLSLTSEPCAPHTAVCPLGKEGEVFFLKEIPGYKHRRA